MPVKQFTGPPRSGKTQRALEDAIRWLKSQPDKKVIFISNEAAVSLANRVERMGEQKTLTNRIFMLVCVPDRPFDQPFLELTKIVEKLDAGALVVIDGNWELPPGMLAYVR